MILADKIILLRKKMGYSQEELAERMNVSRQAVSKWESGQAYPDIDRILEMSEIFGVTTDYLLKDSMGDEESTEAEPREVKRLSESEVDGFLKSRRSSSVRIAIGVFLCIISPIWLIVLTMTGALGEGAAIGFGIGVLLLLVAVAVGLFVFSGLSDQRYEYLRTTPFVLDRIVSKSVSDMRSAFRPKYIAANVVGVCLCVLSPLPLIIFSFGENASVIAFGISILLLAVATAVFLFVFFGVREEGMKIILQDGEFNTENKNRENKLRDAVESLFWIVIVCIYLAWSFATGDWHITWIIWPIAAAASAVINFAFDFSKKK